MRQMTLVQSAIASLERGIGAKLIRGVLLLTVLLSLFGFYAYIEFRGLIHAEAMENAQLARSLAKGRGFSTKTVRPVDIWFLNRNRKEAPDVHHLPDLRHAPLFPGLVSLGFRAVKPSFSVTPDSRVFAPEKKVVIPICILFALGAGGLVYVTARRLFDERVALVATFAFFLSEPVLAGSISGTPICLLMLLVAAALLAAANAARLYSGGAAWHRWLLPLSLLALLCGAAFLARYALLVLLPAVGLFVWMNFDRLRWPVLLAIVVVFALASAPWIARNQKLCGNPLGITPYAMLSHSVLYEEDSFDRSLAPEIDRTRLVPTARAKLLSQMKRVSEVNLKTVGSGWMICFFLVSLMHRFQRNEVNTLRWSMVLGILLLMFTTGLFGNSGENVLNAFLPVVVLYGTAFFFVLLDRFEFMDAGIRMALAWLMVAITAVPAALNVVDANTPLPYPPCFPPYVSHVSGLLKPTEVLCSDIPWATAWYGNRTSVLLPQSVDDFQTLHRSYTPLHGLYLTQETSNKPYQSKLVSGADRSWLPLLEREVSADFPLQHGIALPPGSREQIFLTDQLRWNDGPPEALAEESEDGPQLRPRMAR